MFKSHRIQRQSSLKEFPDPSPLKKNRTGRERKEKRDERDEREGEKEQEAGLNWLYPFRDQQSSTCKCL